MSDSMTNTPDSNARRHQCGDCSHIWSGAFEGGCPNCGSMFGRAAMTDTTIDIDAPKTITEILSTLDNVLAMVPDDSRSLIAKLLTDTRRTLRKHERDDSFIERALRTVHSLSNDVCSLAATIRTLTKQLEQAEAATINWMKHRGTPPEQVSE